jgi:hypothetical protein
VASVAFSAPEAQYGSKNNDWQRTAQYRVLTWQESPRLSRNQSAPYKQFRQTKTVEKNTKTIAKTLRHSRHICSSRKKGKGIVSIISV